MVVAATNYNEIDKFIRTITKDEDVAQDIWVYLIENDIYNIEDIKILNVNKIKRHNKSHINRYHLRLDRKVLAGEGDAALSDFIPSQPLEPFNDGGYVDDLVKSLTINRVHHGIKLRVSDAKCKYCYSDDVSLYGAYKYTKLLWCNKCKRKFRDNGNLFYKRVPREHIEKALELLGNKLSYRKVQAIMAEMFKHRYSTCTIHRWKIFNQRNRILQGAGNK